MMINPKEKAEELYSNYLGFLIKNSNLYIDNGFIEEQAKQCAIIAVDEILNQFTWKPSTGMSFWEEVKKEIEKL